MHDAPVRVGILTFHWATNYGAALQAYALQLVLRRAGYEAEIIDFVPYRVYLAQAAGRLRARQYREFLKEYRIRRFVLRNVALSQQDDELLRSAEEAATSVYGNDIIRLGVASLAVEEWLSSLRNASFVVSNSYHAVIVCIQFNVPFIVVPASGNLSGMNDRMDTLLSTLGLAERILGTEDRVKVGELLRAPIDWVSVEAIGLGQGMKGGRRPLGNLVCGRPGQRQRMGDCA